MYLKKHQSTKLSTYQFVNENTIIHKKHISKYTLIFTNERIKYKKYKNKLK